ncbi:transglycosylase SLT domain-containing protein [Streptomyces sp. NPDC049954]|uniref:transglycosylase SLT domain-containing protein n=1 Tax=Streptomyces sp. NPDC049954 TaxID=3155779 RepID=UPI00341BFF24
MPAMGNNRRRTSRSLTRGLIAVSTGGAALALPLFGANIASAAQSHPAAEQKVAAGAPAGETTPAAYSVVSGDTLAKIARNHSVDGGWHKLYQDNRQAVGDNPDLIHPGLKLTIGGKAEAKVSGASAGRSGGADRADRSQRTSTPPAAPAKPATETAASKAAAPAAQPATYTNDLDGWIKQSLAIMAEHGIPGSYEGIHRNVMRESSGNPTIVNDWDSNAAAGTPSKGLLQVIDPTFQAYHVPGTSMDSFDPVANITAACNYAAHVYGSIDNVNGPY